MLLPFTEKSVFFDRREWETAQRGGEWWRWVLWCHGGFPCLYNSDCHWEHSAQVGRSQGCTEVVEDVVRRVDLTAKNFFAHGITHKSQHNYNWNPSVLVILITLQIFLNYKASSCSLDFSFAQRFNTNIKNNGSCVCVCVSGHHR